MNGKEEEESSLRSKREPTTGEAPDHSTLGQSWFRSGAIKNSNATRVTTYQTRKTGRQTINANYDVVAEAEAILAEAALVTV